MTGNQAREIEALEHDELADLAGKRGAEEPSAREAPVARRELEGSVRAASAELVAVLGLQLRAVVRLEYRR